MCRHTQGSVGLWIMPRSCLQGRRRWCSKHVSIHESESHVACDDIGTHHEPHVTSGAGGMRWAGCLFMVWCANTLLAGIYWCVVAGGYGACVQGSSPTQVQVCDLHLVFCGMRLGVGGCYIQIGLSIMACGYHGLVRTLRLAWCCDTCVALVRLHDPHPARATVRDLTSVCGQKQKYNYDPTG